MHFLNSIHLSVTWFIKLKNHNSSIRCFSAIRLERYAWELMLRTTVVQWLKARKGLHRVPMIKTQTIIVAMSCRNDGLLWVHTCVRHVGSGRSTDRNLANCGVSGDSIPLEFCWFSRWTSGDGHFYAATVERSRPGSGYRGPAVRAKWTATSA